MRIFGILSVVLIALSALLVGIAFLLPREVTVTREIVVDAPPAAIFPHINSLKQMAEWSPWPGNGPGVKASFTGPPEGVGNRMSWTSDDPRIGEGSEEIIVSEPDRRVETALDFGDVGIATSWKVLKPEAKATLVIWGLQADTGRSPVGRYVGLVMDRWVGADFESGLAALKSLVEAGTKPS